MRLTLILFNKKIIKMNVEKSVSITSYIFKNSQSLNLYFEVRSKYLSTNINIFYFESFNQEDKFMVFFPFVFLVRGVCYSNTTIKYINF